MEVLCARFTDPFRFHVLVFYLHFFSIFWAIYFRLRRVLIWIYLHWRFSFSNRNVLYLLVLRLYCLTHKFQYHFEKKINSKFCINISQRKHFGRTNFGFFLFYRFLLLLFWDMIAFFFVSRLFLFLSPLNSFIQVFWWFSQLQSITRLWNARTETAFHWLSLGSFDIWFDLASVAVTILSLSNAISCVCVCVFFVYF